MVPVNYYLALAACLFCIGLTGVVVKRNMLVVFMCVELMLNSANLTFLAFSRQSGNRPRRRSAWPSSSRCSGPAAR